MADVATLWDDMLGHVRLTNPDLSRGWFRDLEPGEVDHGVLQIRARNAAQSRYLQMHCRVAFVEAAQAATGRLVSVQFLPDGEEDTEESQELFGGPDEQIKLNEEYVFENFVTGPCNRLAHAAATAVVDDPGRSYNPLFIYGPVGLGKTHLLQAVCQAISNRRRDFRYHYISCETFVNQFISCVERGALSQFRFRYRHVETLVIDDIQFLAERERSQEEFFHTFNTLYQSQRQIILSADCSPEEIPSLEERLVSRFNSGLVALLDRPCKETRMAILRNKAKLRCIEVPEDVVNYVAGKSESSIRELEGILIRLDALSHTHNSPITLELAREALGERSERPIPIPAILEVVSKRFSVKIADLLGKKRSKSITHPRHVSMYLARQLTSQSLEEIGGYFGGRDHTTVLHANRTISRAAEDDPKVATMLEDIAREVRAVV
ncbi:MAG: chromosomal replication initiator protein DnaA [Phycisphaerae bacterium]